MKNNTDVVIVGAGPVGLWTAIQTKLRNPHLHIEMFDKHSCYQRKHVLKISKSSLSGCAADPRLKKIIKDFTQSPKMSTNLIEEKLSGLAKKLEIKIHKDKNISDPKALPALFPKAKVFIGADGSHSKVREVIFANKYNFKSDLKYVVEVKYQAQQTAPSLSPNDIYPTLKFINTIAEEHIGKPKDGITPVTIRFFIDKDNYEKMQGATFKHPYTLANESKIQKQVLENINLWLGLRRSRGEVRIPNSEKITVTRLGVYASKNFAKVKNNKAWVLVGDSAFGVPFFRSLNNGLLEGTELSKRIVAALEPTTNTNDICSYIFKRTFESEFQRYDCYVSLLCIKETIAAYVKCIFLDLLSCILKINNSVPWQVNYWTEAQIQDLKLGNPNTNTYLQNFLKDVKKITSPIKFS